jgi:predicted Rossmann-fold nucleotide-binding protein
MLGAMIKKIVSGGQTGVDRAALDAALELGVPCGGWCPKGRAAEDGMLAARYPLTETPSEIHAQRTEWNVRDSDGTLVLTRGAPTEGTALTVSLAKKHKKPCLVLDFLKQPDPLAVHAWAERHRVRTLNVAGPRESKCPGIYADAAAFLRTVFASSGRRRF